MADHAAVTFLLEQVTEVIRGYADLVSGADKEFKKLKQEVIELKDVLLDTSNTLTEDNGVRKIKNEIRAVVYEVEDAIDTCLTEIKGKSRFSRPAANLSFAKKVKRLREEEVKEMLEKANKMKILLRTVGTGKGGEVKERTIDPEIRKDKIVGLKDEEDKIKGYLMQQQDELDIIPVIGMPGLGKTTLTWKIYNDELIRYEFPIRIWVHFSQRFNSRDVLIQIMKTFTTNTEELHSMNSRELCDKVHTCLSQDRFLLVVDDVWKTEHWDKIIHALPVENARGKVMITSREKNVGNHVHRRTKPHMQRPLNEDESWELLQLEIFGRLGHCPYTLQGIGKAIADKCKGIPMTIVVLGGVLKDQYLTKNSDVLVKEKWEEVAAKDYLDLEDGAQVIKDVVALSYHRLPERMRECFLYLGVFPAGYVVQTWTLKQLWIAEGFIQPDGKNSLEKIAEEILNDLISRNLLIVHEMNPLREVKVCRVHDVIRMFCTDEAELQILFKDVKSTVENIATLKDADHMATVHRLCLHSDLNKVFRMKVTGDHVRSFLSFQKDATELDPENISAIFESFPKLRILQSQSVKFKNFPPRLIKLHHLRYIVLCVSDLEIVPDQISLLWNLQTIIIHTNSESLKMRASLWKMIRLKHLKTKAAIVLEKKFESGDPEWINLQTLKRVKPESVPEVAKRATKLRTLGIQGKLSPLFADMPLGNLNELEKLKLYQSAALEGKLSHFPTSKCFPPNLQRLTLSKTFLEWKHMSTLAMIQSLKVLKLKENAFTGISWEAEKQGFGKLQVLHMLYLDLVIWTASDSTFPSLRHLELKNCEKLNTIPDDKLMCLESLDVGRVRKPIAETIRNLALQKSIKNPTFQLKLSADLIA